MDVSIIHVKPPAGSQSRVMSPVIGCPIGCRFCYAARTAKKRKTTDNFRVQKFRGPYAFKGGMPELFQRPGINHWTLTDMSDFGLWDIEWQRNVLSQCIMHSLMRDQRRMVRDTFTFVTRFPERLSIDFHGIKMPNIIIGTSVSTTADIPRIKALKGHISGDCTLAVFFEPVLGDIKLKSGDLDGIGWVVIGAETGFDKGRVAMGGEWVDSVLGECMSKGVPIYMKGTVKGLVPIMMQQYPVCMLQKTHIGGTDTVIGNEGLVDVRLPDGLEVIAGANGAPYDPNLVAKGLEEMKPTVIIRHDRIGEGKDADPDFVGTGFGEADNVVYVPNED